MSFIDFILKPLTIKLEYVTIQVYQERGKGAIKMKIKTYADYGEALTGILADECSDEEVDQQIAELEVEYPEFAARQHAQRDARMAQNAPYSKPEPAETIGLAGQYTEGQQVEVDGMTYIIDEVFYISEQQAEFLDDVEDVVIAPGWRANARRKHE
jgi:hypothetical protein